MRMYAVLDKDYIEKNSKEMIEESISNHGDKGEDEWTFSDDIQGTIEEIDEDKSELVINVENSKIGYFSFEVKISAENMIELISLSVHKLNKFKNILEDLE